MVQFLILVAVIITISVFLNNASFRIGIPVLLAFIILGMLFGNNGLVPVMIHDYKVVEQICTFALIFIIFYGGFGTNWKTARPVAAEAFLLSTLGVIITAAATGFFCRLVLHWGWIESFLTGAVISSTDAASVFSILRSRKLGLRNRLAPLLEMESGSNDPASYMMTIILLSLLKGDLSSGQVIGMFAAQLGFGALAGVVIAYVAVWVIRRVNFATSGFDSLFIVAVALFSSAIPTMVGGNGYLSAYIVGIVLGNIEFNGKKKLVNFFDGITGLMQVLIFFMLGLLAQPVALGRSVLPALAIFAILLLVARPLALTAILLPTRKYHFRDLLLLSFCGLRGAASIVFAIIAVVGNTFLQNDLFNVVFCVVLISIALQGTLIPVVAGRLGLIDSNEDVMKTFSDFSDELDLQFSELTLHKDNPWCGSLVKDLMLPRGFLLCLVEKGDGSRLVPTGNTRLDDGDKIVFCTKEYSKAGKINVVRHTLRSGSRWTGSTVSDYSVKRNQLLLIQRGQKTIIPNGKTVLKEGDILYINKIV